jgi:hypothetical protein
MSEKNLSRRGVLVAAGVSGLAALSAGTAQAEPPERRVEDKDVLAVYAGAVLKEIPLGQLALFMRKFGTGPDALANGNGCGNGCGGNCSNALDQFGHLGITEQQLKRVLGEKAALRKELQGQIEALAKKL